MFTKQSSSVCTWYCVTLVTNLTVMPEASGELPLMADKSPFIYTPSEPVTVPFIPILCYLYFIVIINILSIGFICYKLYIYGKKGETIIIITTYVLTYKA